MSVEDKMVSGKGYTCKGCKKTFPFLMDHDWVGCMIEHDLVHITDGYRK